MGYTLRRRVSLSYQLFDKATSKYSEPVSMQIKYFDCGCGPDVVDARCPNGRTNRIIDWVNGKPVTLQECPRRFDDSDLWRGLYVATQRLKEMSNSLSFYGIPEAHIVEPVQQLLDEMFAARDRYEAQKAHMESL